MKFSILTVVLNRAETIGQTLESLAAQSHEDYEHIVQDGCSTDGTHEILSARLDCRMKFVCEQDGGIYDALNRALARATGDVVGVLHSDDYFAHSEVLSRVARLFADREVLAVYGDLDYVSADDPTRIVRKWSAGKYSPEKLRRGWMPPHPALFLRREVIDRMGGYDTSFRIAADYDAVLRYFGRGRITAAYLPEVLVKMRLGGASNRSISSLLRKSREDYRALRLNNMGGLGVLLAKNLRKISQFL